ncbi:MAG: DUF3482 domain-containing protein [Chitinispirillia bacterium]|jgi:GTPase Era involved in 16S rRNA processing
MNKSVPVFAVLGHPNEGKSSVVSTLTENDKIRISSTPGETIHSKAYSVIIDNEEIIRFVDTPGFQVPKKTLVWFKAYTGTEDNIVKAFINEHSDNEIFKDECELFKPVVQGAGIIYVVDGSKPVRSDDKAEMEILRLTGKPRMAIINSKAENEEYLPDWKNEFRKTFNSIRIFNSNKANYIERIALLTGLKSIDQDWESQLEKVTHAFKEDWKQRNLTASQLIFEEIENCITYSISSDFSDEKDESEERKKLIEKYQDRIKKIEHRTHNKIKKLFKHNIFNITLPEYSVLHEDLFSSKTYQVLGLTQTQLMTIAALSGGAIGALVDVAAAGISFGVFTAIGGAIGAGSALLGGKSMSQVKIVGLPLGGNKLKVGPNENVQFLFILLDRALLYYSHVINWAHGRRDYPDRENYAELYKKEKGYTTLFSKDFQKICLRFFRACVRNDEYEKEKHSGKFHDLIEKCLKNIINDESI